MRRSRYLILLVILVFVCKVSASASAQISAPSAILVEGSTGEVIYEKNASERRSPASITKLMTLYLTFEQLEEGKAHLNDEVFVSDYAASMGGSQVFLAEGEVQSLDTLIKCIAVASGNDASVAVAEHLAGTEEGFVKLMNEKAKELGMTNTHFEDCCGLTDLDDHYTCAKDIAQLSCKLIGRFPQIYDYTKIWMEDFTHHTSRGDSTFTLTSTNKLLKQYAYTTGLKTGSTDKAKYCISASARKDNMDLIAVIMGAPDSKSRFQDAKTLLGYGFHVCRLYVDEERIPDMEVAIECGDKDAVIAGCNESFRYVDTHGADFAQMKREIIFLPSVTAPVKIGDKVGEVRYTLNGANVGNVPILAKEEAKEAAFKDYLIKIWRIFLL